ncbi:MULTISPECIES: spore protease YyaC [Desulfitobacterium]|uniref:Putative sporulation protein YyaC n=1 Tax=Desulfitobacterium dehalogenans (strain ATCC 51507 / DSM 9161 / JW/IU-DC1) TaxID=756499 RepID=I4AEW6_DESDJ|nr:MULTISPECIES: spore protease YyaC [Desulfitobacterium]AFM02501.1 putative sporulation protein YyaC [Desulfitobacterium dehalogenans ATCC 51507]
MGILSVFTESHKYKAHFDDKVATQKMEARLIEVLHSERHRPLVFLCIGTDRSTGDALGPITGTYLSQKALPKLSVLGTLEQPVHAANLSEYISHIQNSYYNPFIIAIDACLGKMDSVGNITLANGPLKPGAGVHKELPAVGEVHLTGIVNVGGFMEYMVLQNTRLGLVWRMAETMSDLLGNAYIKTRLS